MRRLGMLLRLRRMLLALGVIATAVLLCGIPMSLRRVLVMLSCFVVFVLSHFELSMG